MIGSLIKITSTPIQLEYDVQPAQFTVKQRPLVPTADSVHTEPAQMNIHSDFTKVRIDTYEARKSLGQYSLSDFAKAQAQKGLQQVSDVTVRASQFGWQVSENFHKGVSIAHLASQRMYEQPSMVMEFLPKGGAQLSWDPAVCNIDYQMGSVNYQWPRPSVEMEYTPAEFNVTVVQYPSVTIEYLGTPNYVPPSADPNYEAEA